VRSGTTTGAGLFDQDGDTFTDGGDDGAGVAGRYFRRH